MSKNWYGIDGIKFEFVSPYDDSQITFEGVTDSANVPVEDVMWSQYHEEEGPFPNNENTEAFAEYMRANAEQVKDLIRMSRK